MADAAQEFSGLAVGLLLLFGMEKNWADCRVAGSISGEDKAEKRT